MEREEILANFQACSGTEDIAQAMVILEQFDWNLQNALNAFLEEEPHLRPTMNGTNFVAHNSQSKMLTFSCKLGETVKDITLDDSSSVADLKEMASIELGITSSETQFEKWPGHQPSDNTVLSSLNLPHLVSLTVRQQSRIPASVMLGIDDPDSFVMPCTAINILTKVYKLKIYNEDDDNIFIQTCEGSRTFLELKIDVGRFTNIQPKDQEWNGFPLKNPPDDDQTIGSLQLNEPLHDVTVKSISKPTRHPQLNGPVTSSAAASYIVLSSDESDDGGPTDNFIDDESMFSLTPNLNSSHAPLMPPQAEDIEAAQAIFCEGFYNRYGIGPIFASSTLQSAIQEAFGKEARERKMIAVYVHHDRSIQSNVFCSQLLCAESIYSYLNQHFVCWGWDVTSAYNKEKFIDECRQHMGSAFAETIKRIKVDDFPILILAQGKGRSCDVTAIIQANIDVNELMMKLMKAVDGGEAQRDVDIKEEDYRKARERIKFEQEEAYRESLEADRAKLVAEQESVRIQEEEARKQKEQEKKETEDIDRLKLLVPDEPAPDCNKPISRVRFRAPDGTTFMRSFLASDTLQTLTNYAGSKGYRSNKYRILKPWPKTNLLDLDQNSSLQSNKIYPQESLIIEELPDYEE